MTKRLLALLLMLAMMLTMLVACQNGEEGGATEAPTGDATIADTEAGQPTEAEKPTEAEQPTEPATTPDEQPTDAPEQPTDAPEEPTDAPEQPTDAPEQPTEPEETKPADGIYDTAAEKAAFVALSFDECEAWAGETELCKFFTPGQSASMPEVNEVPAEADAVRIWGWLGSKHAFKTVGYQIDGGTPVFADEWLVDADSLVVDAVKNSGGSFATRFSIWADVSTLTTGEHTIRALYKLVNDTVVAFQTVKINVGYRKAVLGDATGSFVSDGASQSGKFDSTDLPSFFTVELPTGGSHMDGATYVFDGISDMYAAMDGQYSILVKDFRCDNAEGSYLFVRGVKVVHSADVPSPGSYDYNGQSITCYPINNYYETDGHPEGNSTGGSGICIALTDAGLTVTIKAYDPDYPSHVANYRFTYACEGSEMLVTDDNNVVAVYVNRKPVVTIALDGTAFVEDYTGIELVQDVHFVKTVTLTGADGTVNTVTDSLVVDNAASDIGFAVRSKALRFTSVEVKALSETSVPNMPLYIAGPDFLMAQYEAGTNATIQHSAVRQHRNYVTFKSTDGDPYVAVVNLGANIQASPYAVLKYRTTGGDAGEFFIGSASGWHGGDDEARFNYVNDGEWHLLVVDVSTVTSFNDVNNCAYCRLDYFLGNSGEIDIAYFAFFASEEEALAYDAAHPVEETLTDVPAADLFDGYVTADGLADASGSGYTIETLGTPEIADFGGFWGMNFNKNGNVKVIGIYDRYDLMQDGFTMQVSFKTGSNVNTEECVSSNLHAGGYGFDLENGTMCLLVRIGDAYVTGPIENIKPNTLYNLTGVWDGTTIYMYSDGELISTTPAAGTMGLPTVAGAHYLCFGGDSDASGAGELLFEGTVFTSRIWSEPLNADQVYAQYELNGIDFA